MARYIPVTDTKDGSDLTGSDGDSNRTLTLENTDAIQSGMTLTVSGQELVFGSSYDYTMSANVITFLSEIYDDDVISVSYFRYVTSTSSGTIKYTTLAKFNRFMQYEKKIPNRDQEDYPNKEEVGTGDASTTLFYLDNNAIIDTTLTLYYGASQALATNTLTETTHYTIDNDTGVITLTTAGVTLLATNVLYAVYEYNKHRFEETYLTEILINAESEIDRMINTVFYDSTEVTPDFGVISNELHQGKGAFQNEYQMDKYPVNDTTTTLNGALTNGAGTITVVSTSGFPTAGFIGIGTDKITYTGKTTTTFTGCSGVDNDYATGYTVTSWVTEYALDGEGNEPTWYVAEKDVGHSIDFDSGNVKLNATSADGTILLDTLYPPKYVWDRVRFTYQYGYPEIYSDIVRLVHLIAGKELFNSQVLNSLSRGTNGFETGGIDDIDRQIKTIFNKYRCWLITDTKP